MHRVARETKQRGPTARPSLSLQSWRKSQRRRPQVPPVLPREDSRIRTYWSREKEFSRGKEYLMYVYDVVYLFDSLRPVEMSLFVVEAVGLSSTCWSNASVTKGFSHRPTNCLHKRQQTTKQEESKAKKAQWPRRTGSSRSAAWAPGRSCPPCVTSTKRRDHVVIDHDFFVC